MNWSNEARAALAEDRRRENHALECWDEERRDAFARDFCEEDNHVLAR